MGKNPSIQDLTDEAFQKGGTSHPYFNKSREIIENDHVKAHGRTYDLGGLGLKGIRMLRAKSLAATASQPHKPVRAEDIAKGWGDEWLANEIEESHKKDLNAGLTPAGTGAGAIVPVQHIREFIESLKIFSVVRAAGAEQIMVESSDVKYPRQTDTYGNIAPNAEAAAVNEIPTVTVDQVRFQLKQLRSHLAVSNSLLKTSDPSADVFVRNLLMRGLAQSEDRQFLQGDGTGNNMSGLTTTTSTQTWAAAAAGAEGLGLQNAFGRIKSNVYNSNVELMAPAYFMQPGDYCFLSSYTSPNANLFFPDFVNNMYGVRPIASNNVPDDEVIFAEMSEVMIATRVNMSILMDGSGAYLDNSGTLISALSRDETVISIVTESDMQLKHAAAVSKVTGFNLAFA